jgi:hypothetical protein
VGYSFSGGFWLLFPQKVTKKNQLVACVGFEVIVIALNEQSIAS